MLLALRIKAFLKNFKKLSKTIRILFSVMFILIIVLTLALSISMYALYKNTAAKLAVSLDSQEEAINNLTLKLKDIEGFASERADGLTLALSREQEERAKLVNAQKDIQTKTESTIQTLEKTIKDTSAPNLSIIIESWQNKIVPITCTFPNGEKYGSGTIALVAGNVKIATNKHVVTNESKTATTCQTTIDGIKFIIEKNNISVSSSKDHGFLTLPQSDTLIRKASTFNACTYEAKVGDSMVILGFPAIGSTSQVTATEGIVSGKEGDYYITSAKVEQGNSGGAAILSKGNCYAGIPTFARKGGLESLARILKQEVIFKIE